VLNFSPLKGRGVATPWAHGCETWSLTLRQEHRLRVFENRLLRRVFGSEKDDVRGEWRRLHKEELYDPYCSPNITQVKK